MKIINRRSSHSLTQRIPRLTSMWRLLSPGVFLLAGTVMFAPPAFAQTNSTWLGGLGAFAQDKWSDTSLWNPHTVPNGNYNVTVAWNPAGSIFNGPELDTNISITNLTTVNRAFIDNQFFAGTNLTVTGTTNLTTSPGHDGEGPVFFNKDGTWLLGTLANYDAATHTLNDAFFGCFGSSTIGFRNADIFINKGTIDIEQTARLIDQNNNLNAFRNLATNQGGFEIDNGYNFTTVGNFSNNGSLGVKTFNRDNVPFISTTFTVTGSLTNYNVTTHVLSGGYYDVEVNPGPGSATLRLPSADIYSLDNATIKLVGAGASITDLGGQNALRHFSGIQGGTNLTNAGTLTLTPNGGTFTNDNATHTIDNGANITVQGNHHSLNGGVTYVGNSQDSSLTQAQSNTTLNTTLTINGNSIIEGGGLDFGGEPNVNTQYHTELHVINGIEFRGAYLTGTGTTFADVGLIQGSVLRPGHSPGQLTFQGNLSLDSTTEVDIQLGGTSAGDQFDQVVQSGGTLTVGGNLLITFTDNFQYQISRSDTFDIMTSGQALAGSFANIVSGHRIATNDRLGTFLVSYSGANRVTLSDYVQPAIISTSRLGNHHILLQGVAVPNEEAQIQATADLADPNSWQSIAGVSTGNSGIFAFEDTNAGNFTRRYYRIVYPNPPASARTQSRPAFALARKT